MQLKQIKDIFHSELDAIYTKEEVDHFFYWVIEHYLGLERFVLVLNPLVSVSREEEQPLFEALAGLKQEKPIQYILGSTHFMDMEFAVNGSVLIPRPETEELLRWILEDVKADGLDGEDLNIIDVGTGSGCIAVVLAKELPQAAVYGIDVSSEALSVAGQNAGRHEVKVSLMEMDIASVPDDLVQFDIIVSNPPYVRYSEKESMRKNVKDYEPALALFVKDDDPLYFYKKILDFTRDNLKPGGRLYFEINQYLAEETKQLLQQHNFSEIELRKDSFGNYRMLKAIKPRN
ncbi:peptide chain release factor N(5)-glutamine methyltransferase [Poritiphilus flavus]|uniref:Release factor glutamine methyltransferase n=1 Tax=Poritiphilus flavus TaxID=2697053 RepID=A0A6L9EGI8_9FLAO|nr:peptide chain release factor N(5)-glutamine methyltransferase [Poritiphilus flavus]NAS13369.1 peptide chain release factor N(5)-glutamine methyltransferase [Poritiphilus flavus]